MKLQPTENFFLLEGMPPELLAGVCGKNSDSPDYAKPPESIRSSEGKLIEKITGIPLDRQFYLIQEHGDTVISIDGLMALPQKSTPSNLQAIGTGDALLTARTGNCLIIRTADCVPILIYDPVLKILAMVHSGWRGTQKNICGKTLSLMEREHGSDPMNCLAAILPSIGPRSYEVQDDVAQFFPGSVTRNENSFLLNLWHEIEGQLESSGVKRVNIHISGICTFANNDQFYSHRRGDSGRNLNFALLR